MRRLRLTVLLVLAPLTASALALGAYLNYASVRNTFLDLVGERMEVLSRRIANDAHLALGFGLPLAGQDALGRSLVREAAADALILSVDVVSSAGSVLFSSDPARVGTADPGAADAAAQRLSSPILSPFETVEGEVVVRASRADIGAALGTLGRSIGTVALAAFALGLAAIAAVAALNVRALAARLTQRAPAGGGREVPAEVVSALARVDAEHRAIAARIGAGS